MKEFTDRVAVVTGAASGIGRALAERCAREGMKIVLADIEEEALAQTAESLRSSGATALAVRTDVSRHEDMQVLAERTLDAFGGVHLLFNNAGVVVGSTIFESSLADWQWVIGVNLWGLIHGLQVFIPIMLAQNTECHIVNTSSVAGLIPDFGSAPYHVSKHAVVALSENLYHSLAAAHAHVGASVLCPGWVRTAIMSAERNRPVELQSESWGEPLSPEREADVQRTRRNVDSGMPPEKVAELVFRAIREERLYILTQSDWDAAIRERVEDILRPWD